MRDHLSTLLPGFTQLGYTDPGHGLKGKTQWLTDDEDLTDMYSKYGGKHDILLWCLKQMDDQPGSSVASVHLKKKKQNTTTYSDVSEVYCN